MAPQTLGGADRARTRSKARDRPIDDAAAAGAAVGSRPAIVPEPDARIRIVRTGDAGDSDGNGKKASHVSPHFTTGFSRRSNWPNSASSMILAMNGMPLRMSIAYGCRAVAADQNASPLVTIA